MTRTLGKIAITSTLAIIVLCPGLVGAWGAEGHHLVARVAWELMTPTAQKAATNILGGDDFVASATWADDVRGQRPETSNWHFVDIPYEAKHYDPARDCLPSVKGDCVIAAIARARAMLIDTTVDANQRKEALKFLIHFVGDLHQPLNAIDNHDKGGYDVHVASLTATGRPTNLHSVSDSGILSLDKIDDAAHVQRLLADLKAHPAPSSMDVVQWAEESHDIAVRVTYNYPNFSPAGPPKDTITLDHTYVEAMEPILERQIALAGARLAMLLNSALDRYRSRRTGRRSESGRLRLVETAMSLRVWRTR